FHKPGLMKHLKMTAQIAVGQGTLLLQVRENQSGRMGRQRRHDAQARLLVDDAFQPFIGETAARFLDFVSKVRHGPAPKSNTAPPRRRAGRCRTGRPLPTAKAPRPLGPWPNRPPRRKDKKHRLRTWLVAAIDTRRRFPS